MDHAMAWRRLSMAAAVAVALAAAAPSLRAAEAAAPAAAAKAPAADDAHALSASGAALHGAPRCSAGTLTIGGASLPLDQLVALRFDRAAAATLDQGLVLQSGEVLAGVVQSLQADKLVFASDHLGTLTLPAASARLLVLGAQPLETLDGGGAFQGAVLINGDQVAGALSFVNDQAIGINNGRRIVEIPRERAAQVRLARTAAAPAAAGKAAQQYVRLVGGDLIAGRLLSLDDQQCELETAFAGKVRLPAGLLAALWSEGGPLTPLGALKPQGVKQIAQFDESFPFRIDRSAGGGLLSLGGRRAERGLGCHSRCELSWQLDGSYSALVGETGIDDAVGLRGEAVFQVFADGKALSNVAMRGGQPALAVAVPLAGVKLLQLVVDFGADGASAGDHADWCWPVLVKGVEPAAAR
jgi:hypothetical protein